jgi:hypothetical protein
MGGRVMVTVFVAFIAISVTWIVAKVMLSRKWYEAGRLCVITNERTGKQSLARLAQSMYSDQEYAVIAHSERLVHLRKKGTIEFFTPDGEVINEVNWEMCKPPLKQFTLIEDDDTMDQR